MRATETIRVAPAETIKLLDVRYEFTCSPRQSSPLQQAILTLLEVLPIDWVTNQGHSDLAEIDHDLKQNPAYGLRTQIIKRMSSLACAIMEYTYE